MTTHYRRALTSLAAIMIMLAGAVVAATPASSTQTPVMTGIRTGLNTGFDRVVLDMVGHRPGVKYSWGDELRQDGSGHIVWLTGEHFVTARVSPAAAHDDRGDSTYRGPQKFRTRHLRNIMAVAVTGDFEGVLSIGIGTRYRSWVRVFTLRSPTR
ncbi:MAG: AMIN-like domain-containing (lipo)protein, partial [Haloechinothrix sp.]